MSTRISAASLLCFSLVLLPRLAGAQALDPHAVQPERPSVATHAATVAPGWIELEFGAAFARQGGASQGASVPLAAKIGLARAVQLTVAGAVEAPPGDLSGGPGDLTLALKWRFVETRALGRLAVLPNIKLPTGSPQRGTGVDTTDVGIVMIASRSLGAVSLDLNAGYTRRSGDGTDAPRDATMWAVSFGGPAAGRVGWGAEISGEPRTTGPAGQDSTFVLLAGPTFSVRPWLSLDAGFSAQLNGERPWSLHFGGVWNVGSLSR